jgi:hypothetical protein
MSSRACSLFALVAAAGSGVLDTVDAHLLSGRNLVDFEDQPKKKEANKVRFVSLRY